MRSESSIRAERVASNSESVAVLDCPRNPYEGALATVSLEFSRAELLSRGAQGRRRVARRGLGRLRSRPGSGRGASLRRRSRLRAAARRHRAARHRLLHARRRREEAVGRRARSTSRRRSSNEKEHYQSVAAILSGAGLVPLVAADVDFSYPKGSFDTAAAITKLAAQLETTFLGAYLGAAGGLQASSLVERHRQHRREPGAAPERVPEHALRQADQRLVPEGDVDPGRLERPRLVHRVDDADAERHLQRQRGGPSAGHQRRHAAPLGQAEARSRHTATRAIVGSFRRPRSSVCAEHRTGGR